jgi:hypothetical protein
MEFAAVQLLLSASTRCQAPSGRVGYAASVINIDGNSHTVFVARTSSMGNVPAAEAIAQVREDCPRLQHVIFSGIAGGTPYPARVERHVRLGDIVVATDCIVNYGNRKEHEDHQEVRSQYLPGRTQIFGGRRRARISSSKPTRIRFSVDSVFSIELFAIQSTLRVH